ncbi:hypothetical protein Y032_1043g3478 [Ancylostoma ceylanicum]|uniref:Uncharacterized protein n=1 Tax=Ancylostoma ceylanicum TaxID=53326 RepID=A0A016W6M4_9BILA|nr:hypothetical protein Y032_1043g3478 [Ancylostoma ceylanicum]
MFCSASTFKQYRVLPGPYRIQGVNGVSPLIGVTLLKLKNHGSFKQAQARGLPQAKIKTKPTLKIKVVEITRKNSGRGRN